MKKELLHAFILAIPLLSFDLGAEASSFRVHGKVVDSSSTQSVVGVTVDFLYARLSLPVDALPTLVTTNTDANGEFNFGDLGEELSGELQILELPVNSVVPLKETVRLSVLNPTNEVVFRPGPAATLSGTITITNGTTDLTKFRVEVNATEVDVATNGTFLISELPAYQQTMRLIYQDGFYFDERVVPLPALTAGVTNNVQFVWHKPKNSLTTSGVLRDNQGNLLADARIRFLVKDTGAFVGMKTDANGNYAIYDLPADCYAVRAFVGRWGIEQRTLSAADSTFCASTNSSSATPNGWWKFDEGSGATAANSGTDGTAGNAALTNGAGFSTDAPYGSSVRLPSSGSGGTTPAVETAASYNPLAGATKFTVAASVKRESSNNSSNTAARIVSDIDSLGTSASGFEFRFSGVSGLLTVNINGTERNTTVGGIAPADGVWHHVAVVYDGTRPATNTLTGHVHFYVDGVQRGDGNTLASVTVGANTNNLTIGNSSVSRSVLNTLVGKIDNVRIYRNFAPDAVGSGKNQQFYLLAASAVTRSR